MNARAWLELMAGIAATWIGAELLVRGAAHLALRFGVRPLVVGLTVVALGTSSPEAVVSFVAARQGNAGIALGNVLGSNIANVGLILGLVCILRPIPVRWKILRPDLFLMLGATALAAYAVLQSWLVPIVGVILLLILCLSLVYYARSSQVLPGMEREREIEAQAPSRAWICALQAAAGLAILVFGARWLVVGASAIARDLGIPDEIIGATMVAVGTSLPELAASLVAVFRGHHDISIGNIIGSNLMNLLFVLGGVCVLAGEGGIPVDLQARRVLVPVMLVYSFLLWPLLVRRDRLGRGVGFALFGGYLAFAAGVYF
jgi:cation:H+ antiporter